MARKGWYEALASALQKEDQAVMQLATIEPPNRPRVRSLIHRAFFTASTLPALPLLVSTTDIRTPKVEQLNASDGAVVEVVFWTPSTQEQFRVCGRVSIVPAPGYGGSYPPRRGVVCEALDKEGFDWEAKRVEMFNKMSGPMKATWCRPVPGTPLVGGEEKWSEQLPKLGEAGNEEEKRHLEIALFNFALVLIEPFEVDYLELGPYRRTKFIREWENERSTEFKEMLVVP